MHPADKGMCVELASRRSQKPQQLRLLRQQLVFLCFCVSSEAALLQCRLVRKCAAPRSEMREDLREEFFWLLLWAPGFSFFCINASSFACFR